MKKLFPLLMASFLVSGLLFSQDEPTPEMSPEQEQEIQELEQRAYLIQVIINEVVADCIAKNKKTIIAIIRSENKDPEKSLAVIGKVVNGYIKLVPTLLEGMGTLLGLENNEADGFVEEFSEIITKLLPMKLHEWISICINSGLGKELRSNQIRLKR